MLLATLDADTELRLVESRHAQEVFALVDKNRAHLRRWMPWVDRNDGPPAVRAWIEARLADFAAGRGVQTSIVHRGQMIGSCGLHAFDTTNRRSFVGFWIDADFQGRGFITASTRTLVDYAFDELDLNRVELHAAVENTRSRAVAERLGFTLEGVYRDAEWIFDHYVDHAVYGMLRREWQE